MEVPKLCCGGLRAWVSGQTSQMPGSSFSFPSYFFLFPVQATFHSVCISMPNAFEACDSFFLVVGIGSLWPREFHPAVLNFHAVLSEVLARLVPLHLLFDAG